MGGKMTSVRGGAPVQIRQKLMRGAEHVPDPSITTADWGTDIQIKLTVWTSGPAEQDGHLGTSMSIWEQPVQLH